MGFGSTAKKVQRLADRAEQMYSRLSELTEEINALRSSVRDTNDRVGRLEEDLATQQALLEAIAETHDIDVEAVTDARDEDAHGDSGTEAAAGDPTDGPD
jgi:archaellum component FlaC